jgi:hypothetical protein
MGPLIFGLIVLIVVLIYHIVRNKEGFEDAANMPTDVMEAMTGAMKNMPKDKLQQLIDKLDASDKIEDSIKQINMLLNALQDLRPYYSYPKYSFDVFLLKIVDSILLNEITFKGEEINFALSEINRLKMIANITDVMPSEQVLKAKQEASAAKEAEKKAKAEKAKVEQSGSTVPTTPATMQGEEFNNHRCEPACPNTCESDDYIRKDSIPCWNCNLPRS